jgi:flagellar biosynthesis protein FlhA
MVAKPNTTPKASKTGTDWVVPVLGVAMVFVMIVPLPAFVLDLLLATSITASVLVLLTSMYIDRPVQFSVFPSLLLLLTLFRLSLNLGSSRRILLHGNEGSAAAGHVIQAFGQFVVGGNYVVGFVLFIALIVIQFVVINHGAVRIAEVTARFTLDALPGKQMAIDADLAAGLIDEKQARARREQIGREAEFYGAMDGAARFSQRDAMATILITAINIIAGFLIGVFYLGIAFQEALRTYTILTVGDGLVTMIPSLLVSVSGGMVATRASSQKGLSADLSGQLLLRSRPLWIASGVMFTLGLIPGLPKLAFFSLSGVAALLASRAKDVSPAEAKAEEAAARDKTSAAEATPVLPKLDELAMEVGYGLVPLVDQAQGGQLLQRVRALRKHLAAQLGFIVPPVHITDNPQLKPREYVVRVRGAEVARWEMYQDYLLAISSEVVGQQIEGKTTREPAFGVEAKWIQASQRERALAAGYAVVDQTSAVATHLAEVIKQHAYELLTRQETKRLLDSISDTQPKLVEELVPKVMTLGEVQRVLQQLLREQVSIRDLTTVLETMLDTASVNKNPVSLVETIRQALGRSLVRPFLDDEGKLTVITVDPQIEEQISQAFEPQQAATNRLGVSPASFLKRLVDGLRQFMGGQLGSTAPTLLCNSPARFHLRRMLEPLVPKIVVLSPAEVPTVVQIQSAGVLR